MKDRADYFKKYYSRPEVKARRKAHYAASKARHKRLVELIKEAADYLDTNKMTNIMSGSVLHKKFKSALAEGDK